MPDETTRITIDISEEERGAPPPDGNLPPAPPIEGLEASLGMLPTMQTRARAFRRDEEQVGLRFYDMGVINDGGELIDNLFVSSGVFNDYYVPQEDIAAKNEALLELGVENYSEIFRLITREISSEYLIILKFISGAINTHTLRAAFSYWSEDGEAVVLPENNFNETQNFRITGTNAFFNGVPTSYRKTTLSPDIEAEETELFFEGNEKIYLAPAFCNAKAELNGQKYYNGAAGTSGVFYDKLSASFASFPRIALQSIIATFRLSNFFWITHQNPNSTIFDPIGWTAAEWLAFWTHSEYLKNYLSDNADYIYTYTGVIQPGNIPDVISETPSPSMFPKHGSNFPAPPASPNVGGGILPQGILAEWRTLLCANELLAVVEKDGVFYYIWQLAPPDYEG